MRYKLKTAAVFYPVSVQELKQNLRIEHQDMNDLLQALIFVAIDDAQTFTGRQFARATYGGYINEFSTDDMEIDRGPVETIISVKYYAPGAAALSTLDPLKYQLDNIDLTARLRFKESVSVDADRMNPIEIEFTCGWETAALIPQTIKDAIILMASQRYLEPGNESQNLGMGLKVRTAERLLEKYKIQRF